jgi:transposase-like protein
MSRQVRLDEVWSAAQSEAAKIARQFDAAVEAADEKGTPVCPYCFDTDVSTEGFYTVKRAGMKVQRFRCQGCLKRFSENSLPVGTHAFPEQVEIALAFMAEGVPIRATSRALRVMRSSIPWIVPLSNVSLHRIAREASRLLLDLEAKVIEAVGGIDCRNLAVISSTRRVDRGKRIAVSAVDVDSGFWFETAVFAAPPAPDTASGFIAALRGRIKPDPETIMVVEGAAPLMNHLRQEFATSKITTAPLLTGGMRRCAPPVMRSVNTALMRETMELLPIIRTRFNVFEGKYAAAGVPMPRAVRGWTSLLRYASFFLAKMRERSPDAQRACLQWS